MIKAVFFDLDDTLVDVLACHIEADRYVFEKHGFNYEAALERTKLYNFFGMRTTDILRIRRDALGYSEKTVPVKMLETDREGYILNIIKHKTSLLPGVIDTLKFCRSKKFLIAIVSSETNKYIKKCIEVFNLSKYVDFFVSGDDVENGKPDPECYLKAFDTATKERILHKDDCLVVEDSNNGVIAGTRAGLRVCFVPSHHAVTAEKPYYQITSLKEFTSLSLD